MENLFVGLKTYWAQIILVLILVYDVVVDYRKHKQVDTTPVNFWYTFWGTCVICALLYFGGFFNMR